MEDLMVVIGRNIRELRTRMGMSQGEFAEVLKLNGSTVSLWENGRRQISCEDLFRVSLILDSSPNELMEYKARVKEIKESYGRTLRRIKVYTRENKEVVGKSFRYVEVATKKRNRPRYQLYCSSGSPIEVSGINRTIIGFYKDKASVIKELDAINEAILHNKDVYKVRYSIEVDYDFTGLPIIHDEKKA